MEDIYKTMQKIVNNVTKVEELKEVIFYDLEALKGEKGKDFDYHFELLKGNLEDMFKIINKLDK